MKQSISATGILLAVSFFVAGPLAAQMLATSARQLPAGSLKLLAYYQGTIDQDLTFRVNGSGTCATTTPGVTIPCNQAGNVEAEGSGGAGLMKLIYQPWESFQYYAVAGVGNYSLQVPSTTVSNTLSGDVPGFLFGIGMKAVIYPDTIVTPAIALDVSVTKSRYQFNRRFPGGTPGQDNNIIQRLELMQYQVAVETSHLFSINEDVKLEPYGGVKWSRTTADLKDLVDGSHAGGNQDSVTPFIGLKIPVFKQEAFFAEASFVNGYQYAAGLELRFK